MSITKTLAMDDILENILDFNDFGSSSFALTLKQFNEVSKPYYEDKKLEKDMMYDAFWDLRSYARSFYDMDFMPF